MARKKLFKKEIYFFILIWMIVSPFFFFNAKLALKIEQHSKNQNELILLQFQTHQFFTKEENCLPFFRGLKEKDLFSTLAFKMREGPLSSFRSFQVWGDYFNNHQKLVPLFSPISLEEKEGIFLGQLVLKIRKEKTNLREKIILIPLVFSLLNEKVVSCTSEIESHLKKNYLSSKIGGKIRGEKILFPQFDNCETFDEVDSDYLAKRERCIKEKIDKIATPIKYVH